MTEAKVLINIDETFHTLWGSQDGLYKGPSRLKCITLCLALILNFMLTENVFYHCSPEAVEGAASAKADKEEPMEVQESEAPTNSDG